MSKYMETKAQIEKLQLELEKHRIEELEVEVVDIKKRIIAFGITPEMLFSNEDLKAYGSRKHAHRGRHPPKYRLDTWTWSGIGEKPGWFRKALREGKTEQDLLIDKSDTPKKDGK